MERADHLQWAKDRALAYCDAGDTKNAFASMASDLRKHPDLEGHPGIEIGVMLQMSGNLSTPDQMRRWIKGFN